MSRETKPTTFDRIGYIEAESDTDFLSDSFIKTQAYERVCRQKGPECIVSGRTGSGKSALIWGIKNYQDNVIEINPHDLAMDYIVGSDIIKFCQKIDVKLSLFFEYLWRHILIVSILKYHFEKKRKKSWREGVQDLFAFGKSSGDEEAEARARDYLEKWGAQFFQETVERVVQLTKDVETQIESETGLTLEQIKAVIRGKLKLKDTQVKEYNSIVQRVVSSNQIRELNEVSQILIDRLFSDAAKSYFVVIDKLDEDWVDDDLRYKLIRALIETAKWSRRMKSVKLVIALRADFLERTFKLTEDGGFQREKYEDYIAEIKWSEQELKSLVSDRIESELNRQQKNLGVFDILPENVGQKDFFDYVMIRTLLRPRDIIKFINEILAEYSPNEEIGRTKVEEAERRYSLSRISALRDEWKNDYRFIEEYIRQLSGLPRRMDVKDLISLKGEDIVTELAALRQSSGLVQMAKDVFDGSEDIDKVVRAFIAVMYRIGCVGLRDEYTNRVSYSYSSKPEIDVSELHAGSSISIHPMLYSCLGIGKALKGGLG